MDSVSTIFTSVGNGALGGLFSGARQALDGTQISVGGNVLGTIRAPGSDNTLILVGLIVVLAVVLKG